MQNRTDMVGISFFDRIKQILQSKKAALTHVGVIVASFVLSNSFIFGGISPFGAAFCASVPSSYVISSAVGAVFGYTFSLNPLGNMKYIAAVLLATSAKWLFAGKVSKKHQIYLSCAVSFFALAVANMAVLLSGQPTLYDLTLAGAELLLVSGASYFFARSILALGQGVSGFSKSDLSCTVISLAVLLMGFAPIAIEGVSVGRIMASFAVMLCARYGKEGGGAVCGITVGVALALSGGNINYILIAYALGGLVAGVFSSMGRVATAISFIFINAATALFTMQYGDVYRALIEAFVASVFFVAIPPTWLASTGIGRIGQGGQISDDATKIILSKRLVDISTTMKEIGFATQEVSTKLSKMEKTNLTSIYAKVAQDVCFGCGNKTTCWQFKYSDTVEGLNDAVSILKRDGRISQSQMPKHFGKNCCKLGEFVSVLNTQFSDFMSKKGVERRVSKVRGVVSDQFDGVAMMLEHLAKELSQMKLLDPQKTKQVSDYFAKSGFSPDQVICYTDKYDRVSIELEIPNYQVGRLKQDKIVLELSAIFELEFDSPQVKERETAATIYITEKACYTVTFGAFQLSSKEGKVCGDTYDYILNQGGKSHFILSDGMGVGKSAAVDSTMASGLVSRLISAGIGYETALKMVNSALLIKSGDESLATIDACTLDLYTGKAEFYKAGAAPTFILKSKRAAYVESTSLPVGILRGVAFEKSGITLHQGDTVLMVSDGAVATGADWIKSELESLKDCDLQQICEKIATTAKERSIEGRMDDITVLAAQLQKADR